jgi:hypothetical protein
MKTVKSSFFNKMEHHHTGTGKLEIIWIKLFHSAELAAEQTTTCHLHVGHQEVLIYHPVNIFYGDMSKTRFSSLHFLAI